MTIIDLKLRRSFGVRFPLLIQITNAHDILKSLRAHRARVHPQRSADCAGNSFHPLKPAQPGAFSRIGDLFQFRAHARADFIPGNFHLIEITAAWMNDHAANPPVAHEQIRSAADDKKRQTLAPAMANQIGQGRFGPRLHPELSRPAHTQGRVFRERLIQTHIAFLSHNRLQPFGNHEVGGERGKLLVNVAGAQAQDQIARRNHVADIAMQPIQPRLIRDAAMSMRRDFVGDGLAGDSLERRFACRINIGHNHAIGVIESAPELAPQRLGARITMRLEHREHPVAASGFRGGEGRGNLGGMMCVIVHE